MRKIKLVLEYDGTEFHGFQVQPGLRTVQGEIEAAIRRLTGEGVRAHGAARTDAGVHAQGQVVHLETCSSLPIERWQRALNHRLPPDLAVRGAEEAPEGFHARYSARWKTYRYALRYDEVRSPLRDRFAHWVTVKPALPAMAQAAASLAGSHDFAAFAASGGKSENTIRTVRAAGWEDRPPYLYFVIVADGFLYKMVRNLVGTMWDIGCQKKDPEVMALALERGDRRLCSTPAPPQGLCLMEVEY